MPLLEVDVGIVCACMQALRLFGSTVGNDAVMQPSNSSRPKTYSDAKSHIKSTNTINNAVTHIINVTHKDTGS